MPCPVKSQTVEFESVLFFPRQPQCLRLSLNWCFSCLSLLSSRSAGVLHQVEVLTISNIKSTCNALSNTNNKRPFC
ncbi:rCG63471, partial [Rattus norvegicus]